MSTTITGHKLLDESVLMWHESDPYQLGRIKEALQYATVQIREILPHCHWEEGVKLYIGTSATVEQYAMLYFWFCGYGDCMNLDRRKKPFGKPPQ